MNNEKIIDGVKYISTKHAAEITAYAADYIGQLCRGGKIDCKRIGRTWFVSEDAIVNYTKPLEKTEVKSRQTKAKTTRTHKHTGEKKITPFVTVLEEPTPTISEPKVSEPEKEPEPVVHTSEPVRTSKRQVSPFVTILPNDHEIFGESEKADKDTEPVTEAKTHHKATTHEEKAAPVHIHKIEEKPEEKHIRVTEIPSHTKVHHHEHHSLTKVDIEDEEEPYAMEFPDASSFDKMKIYGTHGVAMAVLMIVFVFSAITIASKAPSVATNDGVLSYDNVLDATANVSSSVANVSSAVVNVFTDIGKLEYKTISSIFNLDSETKENTMAAALVAEEKPLPQNGNDYWIQSSAEKIIQQYR